MTQELQTLLSGAAEEAYSLLKHWADKYPAIEAMTLYAHVGELIAKWLHSDGMKHLSVLSRLGIYIRQAQHVGHDLKLVWHISPQHGVIFRIHEPSSWYQH